MAKYLDLRNNYNKNDLQEAAKCIKNGNLVLFSTETIYGIGTDGLNNKIDYILDGSKTESTIIKIIDNTIHILRSGKITYTNLSKYGEAIIDEHIIGNIKKII